MKKYSHWIRFALFCGAAALILSCSPTTQLVDVWKDPSLQAPVNHVLVIAMRKDPVRRRLWEDAFVTQLEQYGVTAVPSYRSFPDEIPDTTQVRDIVTAQGFDGVLTAQALPKEVSTTNVPGTITYEPRTGYNPWQNRYVTHYQRVVYPPYVDSTPIYRYQVDMLMPARDRGQLIWSGTSNTTDPNTMQDLQHEVTSLVVNTLSKQGVIPSRQK
jgi:hypothetical protein